MAKNKNLALLLGLIPGAGQMYLGLMQKGVYLMLACAAVSFFSNYLDFHIIGVLFPIIWFYSFFDTLHLRHLSQEQCHLAEQAFLNQLHTFFDKDWRVLFDKHRILICGIIILIGLDILLSSIILPLLHMFVGQYSWFYNQLYDIPQLIISISLIISGIYFVLESKNTRK